MHAVKPRFAFSNDHFNYYNYNSSQRQLGPPVLGRDACILFNNTSKVFFFSVLKATDNSTAPC